MNGGTGGFTEGCPRVVSGTCTSEERGSGEIARLEVGGARQWNSLVPVGNESCRVRNEVLPGDHVDHVTPSECQSVD